MGLLFMPVRTVEDLDSLDCTSMVKGYLMGLRGEKPPHDRAMYHGWLNGMVDSGRKDKSKWQALLAERVVQEAK